MIAKKLGKVRLCIKEFVTTKKICRKSIQWKCLTQQMFCMLE